VTAEGRHRADQETVTGSIAGNREVNGALHRIAVTQMRLDRSGRACHEKRMTGGDTTT